MGTATANDVHSGAAGDGRIREPEGSDSLLRDLDAASVHGSPVVHEASPGRDAVQPEQQAVRKLKATYIGAPACFALEQACQQVVDAFGHYGMYQVGSSLERQDWRDIDLRYILPDDEFAKLFPEAEDHWEQDPRWLLMTVAISGWLSKMTGLPVDFQFQPQTHANALHKGPRNAYGMRIRRGRRADPTDEPR